MVDGAQVPLPDDHILIFIRILGRYMLGPESLILNFQQVLHPGVLKHGGSGSKVKMLVSVLDLHVDDCTVMFQHGVTGAKITIINEF